ncbi:MAG: ribosome biogenesis GTPase YlqF, partial [Lachnospiraceae bacterium]|nr:ribosome biogenesis GTPase YlqF [Lachnospiraceae bacterium]
LNKADLADEAVTSAWLDHYRKKGYHAVTLNSKNTKDVRKVGDVILKACSEKIEKDRKKGIIGRHIRAMIVGIPNVGKSTFINSFAGKACTKTGNKPGVTKGRQWIRLAGGIELLDTPGILWPKFEDQEVGMRIAFIGSINDDILIPEELAVSLISFLQSEYAGILAGKYGVEEAEDPLETLKNIATKRACMKKGGELDLEKASGFVMDDYRNGRIGRITLEKP